MKKNKLAYLWCSNYLFQFFFCFGIFMPFYQLWLTNQAISSKNIGIILAAGLVSRCLASLLFGSLIKHEEQYQSALRALGMLSLLTSIIMSFYATDFILILIVTCLFNIAIAPIFGLSDAIITTLDKRKVLTYGSARMWGSIGFVAATIAGGYIFEVWSASALPIMLIIICSFLFMSALFSCPQLQTKNNSPHTSHSILPTSDKLYSSTVILLLVTVILLQSSHAFFYGFSSVYWQEIGLSKSVIGYLWGISMSSEILVFFLAKKLFSEVSPARLLQFASLCVMVRWAALAILQDPLLIATAQLLHGGTFALTQVAMIKGVQMYVSDSKIAKFQGVYQGSYTAMIAIFTYFCGLFYDQFKADLFLYMSAIGIVSFIFSVVLNIRFLKNKQLAF